VIHPGEYDDRGMFLDRGTLWADGRRARRAVDDERPRQALAWERRKCRRLH
jgi:hypothetical protein